jgi:hypothetical protein
LINKRLKCPFNIKGNLNKGKSLTKSFSFLKVLFNINKRNSIIITDKELIHKNKYQLHLVGKDELK